MSPTDLTALDDHVLVARSLAGDTPAFGELVRRHQAAALRVASVITGSTEEANDIVQDAFVAAHRALASYRGAAPVRAWMLRIVANHARNHLRAVSRRRRRDDRHAARQLQIDHAPDDDLLDHAERAQLASALQALGADDRAVLGCRFVAGLSERETADTLGVAIGTVKSRTSRALQRLRAELERAGGLRS